MATDKDLAAHITVINQVGITLCEKTINEVFEPIPKQFYVDSILADIENADDEIDANPVYCILNLCRVLAYLVDSLILSKRQGGEWGIIHLPDVYGVLIKEALASYNKNTAFIKNDLSHDFAKYMLKRIFLR